jgi:8-oxo-dGTP pyrophosphatase MutT (NUDIX family)
VRKLAHDTVLSRKHAVNPETYYDYRVGDRVIADSFPGTVTEITPGPTPGYESYRVKLDNNFGGGEYRPGALYREPARQASLAGLELEHVEAGVEHDASQDYPELGSILSDRPPIENLKVYAAFVAADTEDEDDESEDPSGAEAEDGPITAEEQDQPDSCSFCGSQDFDEFQDTGRGTRARCAQCNATMLKPHDGIQWAPEFPNSSQNAPSRQSDSRSVINDPSSVHGSLNVAATAEAGYPIFAGLDVAPPPPPNFEFTATWADVRRKGVRLRKEGRVRVLAATGEGAVGEVDGDTALYETEYRHVPGTRRVAFWTCGCRWSAWANTERSPAYKRFQNRACSHNLALRFAVQSKGAHGREVTPDTDRLEGQHQRSPVTVQYQRPTERAPGRDVRRRSVPPGNVRTEWTPRSRVRVKGALTYEAVTPEEHAAYWANEPESPRCEHPWCKDEPEHTEAEHIDPADRDPHSDLYHHMTPQVDEAMHHLRGAGDLLDTYHQGPSKWSALTPAHEWARLVLAAGSSPPEVLAALRGAGMSHQGARDALTYATASWDACGVLAAGSEAFLVDVDPQTHTATLYDGRQLDAGLIKCATHPFGEEEQDWRHGRGYADFAPAEQDIGIEEMPGDNESDGTDPAQGSGAMQSTGSSDSASFLGTQPTVDPYQSTTPQVPSANPMSTGFATSADPGNWQLNVANPSNLSNWNASLHQAVDERDLMAWHREHGGGGLPVPCAVCGRTTMGSDARNHGSELHPQMLCETCHERVQAASGQHYPDEHMNLTPEQRYPDEVTDNHPRAQRMLEHQTPEGWHIEGKPWTELAYPHGRTFEKYHPLPPSLNSADGGESAEAGGDQPTVSGIALKAGDTGRVLMIQRSNHAPDDPAAGTWEFPGGHHEEGDQTSLHAGIREWEEEVGQSFPTGGHLTGVHRNGPYLLHHVVIPNESAVDFSNGRATTNPDDPDGDDHEQSAWWEIKHAQHNPALRQEVKKTPWDELKKASALEDPHEKVLDPDWKAGYTHAIDDQSYQMPNYEPGLSGYQQANRYAQGYQEGRAEQGQKWGAFLTLDQVREVARAEERRTGKTAEQMLRERLTWQEAVLHEEPEPALPSTDGAAEEDSPDPPELSRQMPWGFPEGIQGPGDPQDAPQPGDDEPGPDTPLLSVPMRTNVVGSQAPGSVLAEFWKTAGGAALLCDTQAAGPEPDSGGAGEYSAAQIAATAREVLAKTGAKDFSFAEQRELIDEGIGVQARARNFDELDLEGTHYALLTDPGDDEDLWL